MKEITVKAYAKINLSLDVKGVLDNGYHIVEMVMQQISLHDDIKVVWTPSTDISENRCDTIGNEMDDTGVVIKLNTTRGDLPNDSGNLAYRAAQLMIEEFPDAWAPGGELNIFIDKHIPVAAGMAGGSSNCAAVLHGINQLWGLGLGVANLCKLGAKLGSDVPFCVMGQAAACEALAESLGDDPLACHCALATGTGTDLMPLPGLDAFIALSKPPIAVSTAEVYKGMDELNIPVHPNNDELILGLKEQHKDKIYKNMVNVLENYTLKVYPNVVYTKDTIQKLAPSGPTLMSGSGPTVFAICGSAEEADAIAEKMLSVNEESFSVHTTL